MRLTLRSVYKEDSALVLYAMLKERLSEPASNISHQKMPTFAEHLRFYNSKPYRVWYLINVDGLPAGSIYASRNNEIGVYLGRDYRGLRIATWALTKLLEKHKPLPAKAGVRSGKWLAHINPANLASLSFFERMQFKPLQVTYAL